MEPRVWQFTPRIRAPPPASMRPKAPDDPAIELQVESSDVGAPVMLAPTPHLDVQLAYQRLGRPRRGASRDIANLLLEAMDGLVLRERIERSCAGSLDPAFR